MIVISYIELVSAGSQQILVLGLMLMFGAHHLRNLFNAIRQNVLETRCHVCRNAHSIANLSKMGPGARCSMFWMRSSNFYMVSGLLNRSFICISMSCIYKSHCPGSILHVVVAKQVVTSSMYSTCVNPESRPQMLCSLSIVLGKIRTKAIVWLYKQTWTSNENSVWRNSCVSS